MVASVTWIKFAIFPHESDFDLLLPFPNMWTLPRFEMISYYFALHSGDKMYLVFFVFAYRLASLPVSMLDFMIFMLSRSRFTSSAQTRN
jgi:hypothetical protein